MKTKLANWLSLQRSLIIALASILDLFIRVPTCPSAASPPLGIHVISSGGGPVGFRFGGR